jgi:hypothetical protein
MEKFISNFSGGSSMVLVQCLLMSLHSAAFCQNLVQFKTVVIADVRITN